MSMRQLIKTFLCVGCLALGFQTGWAFSLLGPVANGGDAWQVTEIGYNPLANGGAPPFLLDPNHIGPKNLGEGYRFNAPVMYYAFDPSFEWFGANGEFAVQQAFDLVNGALNGQTNTPVFLYSPNNGVLGDTNGAPAITLNPTNGVDRYLANLTEFPLNSESENYQANALGLLDLKSVTLSELMEQLGLTDAIRYTWALHDREHTGSVPCPVGELYTVIQRNFDITGSPLNQVQYSAYVNGELYTYYIYEDCDAPSPLSPPGADALEIPADPLNNNPPVASGFGEGTLGYGFFYTGLTRDDVAGLRWLYSTNNYDTPSTGYLESQAAGSVLFSTNFSPSQQQILYTSNYNALVAASLTNDPVTLQGLFPGLQATLIYNSFSNVVSASMNYVTNYPIGGIAGQGYVGLQTTYTTNIVEFYHYAFGNVVTNHTYTNTSFALQTVMVGPPIGWPVGSQFTTNVTTQSFQSNVVSGDYFIISNGACGPNIVRTQQTFVNIVTNTLAGVTNADGSSIVQNLISYFTNYALVVQPCTLVTNSVADYHGVGSMQFLRVLDDNYDYQSGQFLTPITNQYTMVVFTNGQLVTRAFQRVVTTPDFLFGASDQAAGPSADPVISWFGRTDPPLLNTANIQRGLAGPGTINPGAYIAFDKVGPIFENTGTSFLTGPGGAAATFFQWASFDGTTNDPVLYPNGASLANLAAEALVQISPPPPNLPSGTNGVAYNVTLTVTGGQPPYAWTLAPYSAGLPPGLNLSSGGVISGTPTQSHTFDNIIIQMTDSSTPPRTLQMTYSLTIN